MKRWFSYTVLAFSFLVGGFVLGCSAQTPAWADSDALVHAGGGKKGQEAFLARFDHLAKLLVRERAVAHEDDPPNLDLLVFLDHEHDRNLVVGLGLDFVIHIGEKVSFVGVHLSDVGSERAFEQARVLGIGSRRRRP